MAGKVVKIATYNVNGIRSRLPHLLAWLATEKPHIACLQELKAVHESFPLAEIHAAGYGALWKGQRSWNGVAVLARGVDPVESRRVLPGDAKDDQARYLVPTDFDIYDPTSWRKDALLQPESREAWQRLLAQGWTDALRMRHPDDRVYTFWDYFRKHWERDAGLRIDHLLLNPAVAPRLRDAGVDRWVRGLEKASDHAPTWITLGPASRKVTAAKPATGKAPRRVRPKKESVQTSTTERRRRTRTPEPA